MFVSVGSFNYFVKLRGYGKPLVCLHGFGENHMTWGDLEVEGYRLILIDLIGHGKSDKPINSEPYRMDILIRDLHELIKTLDLTKYSILGYSFGGRIALKYATVYKNEIDKIILESASYGICTQKSRCKRHISDTKLAIAILKNGIDWYEKYWSELPIFESQRSLEDEKRVLIRQRRQNNVVHALANTLMGSGQGTYRSLRNDISRINRPMLYISGGLDDKYCKIGSEISSSCAFIRHVRLPGAGHNVHVEDPDAFNRLVNSFLSKTVSYLIEKE